MKLRLYFPLSLAARSGSGQNVNEVVCIILGNALKKGNCISPFLLPGIWQERLSPSSHFGPRSKVMTEDRRIRQGKLEPLSRFHLLCTMGHPVGSRLTPGGSLNMREK